MCMTAKLEKKPQVVVVMVKTPNHHASMPVDENYDWSLKKR